MTTHLLFLAQAAGTTSDPFLNSIQKVLKTVLSAGNLHGFVLKAIVPLQFLGFVITTIALSFRFTWNKDNQQEMLKTFLALVFTLYAVALPGNVFGFLNGAAKAIMPKEFQVTRDATPGADFQYPTVITDITKQIKDSMTQGAGTPAPPPPASGGNVVYRTWQSMVGAVTSRLPSFDPMQYVIKFATYIVEFCADIALFIVGVLYLVQALIVEVNYLVFPAMVSLWHTQLFGGSAREFTKHCIAIFFWPLGWGIGILTAEGLMGGLQHLDGTMAGILSFAISLFLVMFWLIFASVAGPVLIHKLITSGASLGQGLVMGGLGGAGALGVGMAGAAVGAVAAGATALAGKALAGAGGLLGNGLSRLGGGGGGGGALPAGGASSSGRLGGLSGSGGGSNSAGAGNSTAAALLNAIAGPVGGQILSKALGVGSGRGAGSRNGSQSASGGRGGAGAGGGDDDQDNQDDGSSALSGGGGGGRSSFGDGGNSGNGGSGSSSSKPGMLSRIGAAVANGSARAGQVISTQGARGVSQAINAVAARAAMKIDDAADAFAEVGGAPISSIKSNNRSLRRKADVPVTGGFAEQRGDYDDAGGAENSGGGSSGGNGGGGVGGPSGTGPKRPRSSGRPGKRPRRADVRMDGKAVDAEWVVVDDGRRKK